MDAETFGVAFESCRNELHRVAGAALGNDLRAKVGVSDVVQDTFLAAYHNIQGFRGSNMATFRSWLRTILQRRISDAACHFRRRSKRRIDREFSLDARSPIADQAFQAATTSTSPSGHAVKAEERQAVLVAVKSLPESYRDVLIWRYWDRLDFDEIGSRLDISNDAARKRWSRALLKLKTALETDHGRG
ncbi:sigma-70 family RNA polymerase sigma factor [Singulisphaera rosea]